LFVALPLLVQSSVLMVEVEGFAPSSCPVSIRFNEYYYLSPIGIITTSLMINLNLLLSHVAKLPSTLDIDHDILW